MTPSLRGRRATRRRGSSRTRCPAGRRRPRGCALAARRRTRAPSRSIAARERPLRASVLKLTRTYPPRLEGVGQQQQLRLGVDRCPLRPRREPGPADLGHHRDVGRPGVAQRPVLQVEEPGGADDLPVGEHRRERQGRAVAGVREERRDVGGRATSSSSGTLVRPNVDRSPAAAAARPAACARRERLEADVAPGEDDGRRARHRMILRARSDVEGLLQDGLAVGVAAPLLHVGQVGLVGLVCGGATAGWPGPGRPGSRSAGSPRSRAAAPRPPPRSSGASRARWRTSTRSAAAVRCRRARPRPWVPRPRGCRGSHCHSPPVVLPCSVVCRRTPGSAGQVSEGRGEALEDAEQTIAATQSSATAMVKRLRLRSATPELPMLEDETPPPNMSDRPPPAPLCSRIRTSGTGWSAPAGPAG